MIDQERLYRIALSMLFRNRLRHQRELITAYGSAESVWGHIDEPQQQEMLDQARREAEFIEQHHIGVLLPEDAEYPYRLKQCPDAPTVLYTKGHVEANLGKYISIVGTRNASERGKELTRRLVLDIADMLQDVTIVSGLAYGIDVAAHRAALEAGIPTLIIPAHGLDRIYPALHRPVAVEALTRGGIITEYPSGTEPLAPHFVARNRIVAGLADAVVVVESRARGGSLITARMANDYSRDVFTFPGRPSDELAHGCNILIRDQKAALIENADDLVQAMQWESAARQPVQTAMNEMFADLDDTQKQLLNRLRQEPDGLHINLLVMESGLDYSAVSSALMMMEINGIVKGLPGGIYKIIEAY
ncbi:MAG: DNA-processing protein DprA [Paludibacteraceae bacterium]|nr:DNA-processing protein DprA [Paludibacteraceae bacterium]